MTPSITFHFLGPCSKTISVKSSHIRVQNCLIFWAELVGTPYPPPSGDRCFKNKVLKDNYFDAFHLKCSTRKWKILQKRNRALKIKSFGVIIPSRTLWTLCRLLKGCSFNPGLSGLSVNLLGQSIQNSLEELFTNLEVKSLMPKGVSSVLLGVPS